MIHDLIPLMVALVWPVTILVLVCSFRSGIKNLIQSVTEAKIGSSIVLAFGRARTDILAIETTLARPIAVSNQIVSPSDAKWENVADLFWLGNDLDWTAQTILRGAPKEKILHGFRQCVHHSSELGLVESSPGRQLSSLKSQVEGLSEAALDRQWRNDFSQKIYLVIGEFSTLVKQHQPDFRPGPES